MSAPTPAPGEETPREGYYPDPSIPGYVRYWNGAAWVPGTSRPAPVDGALPHTPQAPTPAPPAEETGPVFFDEEPQPSPHGNRPGPAASWGASPARPAVPGDPDRKVSWGSPVPDPRVAAPGVPTPSPAPEAVAPPALPGPGGDRGTRPNDGTLTFHRPPRAATDSAPPLPHQQGPGGDRRPPAASPTAPAPRTAPDAAPTPAPASAPPPLPAPAETAGPGGAAPWAQPPAALAAPVPVPPATGTGEGRAEAPVIPWKPPTSDPFLAAAQAQAAARPAGWGRRLLARLLDSALIASATGAVAAPLGLRAADHLDHKIEAAKLSGRTVTVWLLDGTTATYLGAVLAALLLAGLLFEVLPTARWGRTAGKGLLGLRVQDIEAHDRPSFASALRRFLVLTVPGLLLVGLVGVVWAVFDRPWRQGWHDKAAGTFVAR
ncbi:RDD family protein [Streptomyces sp. NPDC049906]|uniref:RDD family protein n=1 Tax=Streptomyces sp. NPDC049906 TaxID=3155656 RepID=UPI003432A96C